MPLDCPLVPRISAADPQPMAVCPPPTIVDGLQDLDAAERWPSCPADRGSIGRSSA
jgi:hypothetical protein